jgi:hypothetical protein
MVDENNGFKEFVRSEIKNVKDAAERNYDEHKTLFEAINGIKITLALIEERLAGNVEIRKAKIAARASMVVAAITSAVAIVAVIVNLLN